VSGISIDQIREWLLFMIALVMSVCVHEYGHALVAHKLGDRLPESQGRLTLNPTAHIDPVGTLLFPSVFFFLSGGLLGWGRPVQTNTMAYTRRFTRRTGHMLVALAGPAMNLLMALLVSVVVVILGASGLISLDAARSVVQKVVWLNLLLMAFNLIPIPPLDGGAVLARLLPVSMQGAVDFLQRYGFAILLLLMFTGGFSFVLAPLDALSARWWLVMRGLIL